MFKPGAQLGRYRVVGPLGRGQPDGLFEVDDEAGRRFVLRAPVGDLEDGEAVTQRFLPVAQAMRELAHLNVVALFDAFVAQGCVCLVMEKVRGRSLAAANADGLDARAALLTARQILDATVAAHAVGRLHRDLHPSKILLVPLEGWDLVKVADFGLGMLLDEAVLQFGAAALTGIAPSPVAAYMAPEQVRGRSVDERTDIYAIGVMLFEMLAHRTPFPDRDPQLVMHLQATMEPPKLTDLCRGEAWLTPQVLAVIGTALAKQRDERFETAADMRDAVDVALRSIS